MYINTGSVYVYTHTHIYICMHAYRGRVYMDTSACMYVCVCCRTAVMKRHAGCVCSVCGSVSLSMPSQFLLCAIPIKNDHPANSSENGTSKGCHCAGLLEVQWKSIRMWVGDDHNWRDSLESCLLCTKCYCGLLPDTQPESALQQLNAQLKRTNSVTLLIVSRCCFYRNYLLFV